MRKTGVFVAIAACMMLAPATAWAGDFAQVRPIGFSADGGIFAYEEFGIQDGSGSAYSNIYFIDTAKDEYLPGSPIRVQAPENDSGLRRVRAEAAAKASPAVAHYSLNEHPGQLVALNPYSEVGPVGDTLRYYAFPAEPRVGEPYTLKLTETPAPVPEICSGLIEKGAGFQLEFTEKSGKPANQSVYSEDRTPQSRGCPTGYRIAGVVTYDGAPQTIHMALVMVLRLGFEGLDGRWLAVPLKP
ncbi:DUF2259 domain-containing protein [Mycoplana rhizolycopersici]|uniref:DUF2259 domain-containing protein n=1 Tax=Mycoplana rhizolycopersici TaxID=2746702 RepID=A0ABX2QDH1_9HYPH|nr:DUF2259 domain-containing protein [Rhizobium rhizolycopersici]NVP55794.1 DUF2259 domain-containing protein [Rhizobium rhizolycopersici]